MRFLKGINLFLKVAICCFCVITLVACAAKLHIKDVKQVQAKSLNQKSVPIHIPSVEFDLPMGKLAEAQSHGAWCELSLQNFIITSNNKEKSTIWLEYYKHELSKLNVTIDPEETDLVLYPTIYDVKANLCTPWVNENWKGEAYVAVRWNLFSKAQEKIIFSSSTEGSYFLDTAKKGGKEEIVEGAHAGAINNLLNDNEFVKKISSLKLSGAYEKSGSNTTVSPSNSYELINIIQIRSKLLEQNLKTWPSSVVTIKLKDGHGSGFFISENLILTNNHVVTDSKNVSVKLDSGVLLAGKVIRTDAKRDVALIKVDAEITKYFRIEKNKPSLGDDMYAIGSPKSEFLNSTISKGIISAFREANGLSLIQSDVTISPGSSGGPLINSNGGVVGIAVSGLRGSRSEGINFFIPITDALSALNISIE